jgi:hypothetical protein
MSSTLPYDPLLLLLDDPALLEALMAGADPDLASGVATAPAPQDVSVPASPGEPPGAPPPEDRFPTTEELDALLADSYAPEPGLDAATRAELVDAFGLDPALVDDEAALVAALAALEPLPEDDLPDLVSGAPPWDPTWSETVREDWALG